VTKIQYFYEECGLGYVQSTCENVLGKEETDTRTFLNRKGVENDPHDQVI
jgi:hypothetical protein